VIGVSNPLTPCCEGCGNVESLNDAGLCGGCVESAETKRAREDAESFRYMSRYWLAVRPVNNRPMSVLLDERAEQERGAA
jgi:hypothetical protein